MAQLTASIGSTAALIINGGAQYGNETVTILNPAGSPTTVYISNASGVTTTTGFALTPGSSVNWLNPPAAGCYGITASGLVTLIITQNIS